MKCGFNMWWTAAILTLSLTYGSMVHAQNPAPHLKQANGRTQLIVNGKPFLSLAGELHNSSSSSLVYMERLWPGLQQLNLNTVLAPVSWELIEPEEGKFDFSLVDGLIRQAREREMKLIFLWFGSWKNLVSTYAPSWVKKDTKRFPLLVNDRGEKYPMLSSFSEEGRKADGRAFAALMRHIKEVDAQEQTVIMMQIENEVGNDGGKRDCSPVAEKAYNSQVPADLVNYLSKNKKALKPELKALWDRHGNKTKGSWPEIFGNESACNEIFMSWYLADYIGYVIEAGKAEYDIPMFVNAAIGRQTLKQGSYPSGGPLPFVMDIWRAAAPELDMLSPDIYYGDFDYICQEYTFGGNPLYIPETRGGNDGAMNAIKAFCNYGAIGFSPFGIENSIRFATGNGNNFAQMYATLNKVAPLILERTPGKDMLAVVADSVGKEYSAILGNHRIDYKTGRGNEKGYAAILQMGPNEFLVIGRSIQIEFSAATPKKDSIMGVLMAEEGDYKDGQWIAERVMNGDEIMRDYDLSKLYKRGKSGTGLAFGELGMQKVTLYTY